MASLPNKGGLPCPITLIPIACQDIRLDIMDLYLFRGETLNAWKLKTTKRKRRGRRELGIEQTHKRNREFPTVIYALPYQVGGM
jgi:hypothetical protein